MVDIISLQKQIQDSEALKIHHRLKMLDLTHHIIVRNYRDLQMYLKVTQNPESFAKLWVVGKEHELDLAMAEVTRYLLNFVGSAKARIDITRNIMKRSYHTHKFYKEYRAQVDARFTKVPLAQFIEDLRNYSLHYRLPIAGADWEIVSYPHGKSIPYQAFMLDKEELQQANWKWPKGYAFLEGCSDKIRISDLVEKYFTIIQDFHYWMMIKLRSIHRQELEWLNEKSKIVQDASDRAFRV